jgi:hypothetical protein
MRTRSGKRTANKTPLKAIKTKAKSKTPNPKKSKLTKQDFNQDPKIEPADPIEEEEFFFSDEDASSQYSASTKQSIKAFAKNIKLRRKRGNKMNKLIRQQKYKEDLGNDVDDFWKENKYFGKIEDIDDGGDEDSASDFDALKLKHLDDDSFDEDFGDSSSGDGGETSMSEIGGKKRKKKVNYKRTKKSKLVRDFFLRGFFRKGILTLRGI